MQFNSRGTADEVIDRAAEAFRSAGAGAPPADLSKSVVRLLQESDVVSRPAAARPIATRRMRIGAAALALTLLGLALWPGLSGRDGLAASVADAVGRLRSVSYTMVESVEGRPDRATRVLVSGNERMRAEFPDGEVLIVDTRSKRQARLIPDGRRAVIRSAFGLPEELSPLTSLCTFKEQAAEQLGDRVIDGRQATGFILRGGPFAELTVWVDRRTSLPIRMESGSPDRGENAPRVVIHNFVYDKAMDDSLFSVKAPGGYSVDESLAAPIARDTGKFRAEPGVGVGPVRFGMTPDDVMASLGKPDARETRPEGDLLDYGSIGLRFEFRNNEGLGVIRCVSQLAYGYNVRTFAGKTDKGVAMGTSTAAVKEAYGAPDREFNPDNGLMMYIPLATTFRFREGKLCEIVCMKPGRK